MSEQNHTAATYGPEARDLIFTVPNLLSVLRIISIPFIAWLMAGHHMVPALIVFALSSATDGFDGLLARKLLDPFADRLLILSTILALGIAGIIPWWMLIVVALRDVLMAVQILWIAQYGYGPLPVHFVGKTATALLMIAVVGLTVADLCTGTAFRLLHLAALAAGIWGVAMYWLAGYIYFRQGIVVISRQLRKRKDTRP